MGPTIDLSSETISALARIVATTQNSDPSMSDSYFWFYSTAAQVFSGISAILGVFLVYKLQQIQDSIEWSRSDLETASTTVDSQLSVKGYRLDEQIERAEKQIANWKANNHARGLSFEPSMRHAIDVIQFLRKKRSGGIKQFKLVLAWTLIQVATALIAVPLCNTSLATSCIWLWGYRMYWVSALLNVACVYHFTVNLAEHPPLRPKPTD